jgi:hypothetical protein
MRPFGLLCCTAALPSTLTHLVHLLPDDTVHIRNPKLLGTVLTPFLVLLAANTQLAGPARTPIFRPYVVLIQVKRIKPISVASHLDGQIEIGQEHSEPRYFAVITPGEEEVRENMVKEMVKGQQLYQEVKKAEAERILRFRGSGGEILGDGETWTRVEGAEKIWCEHCKVWWEFKAWIREL